MMKRPHLNRGRLLADTAVRPAQLAVAERLAIVTAGSSDE